MKRSPRRTTENPYWSRAKRVYRALSDRFPLTILGVLVSVLASVSLWFGIRDSDLVLTGAGAIVLVAVVTALAMVLVAALRIYLALRRLPSGATLAIECGFPVRTGFRLPRLWWMPGVQVEVEWAHPAANAELVARGSVMEEQVHPDRRGWSDTLERRITIGEPFGLASLTLHRNEARPVRMLPSVGGLKHMHVVRTLSGGDELAHPDGTPDGERFDMRQYGPGDPIRFVLWNVFARSRQLVVRTPERAVSASKKTLAYLVAGDADEAAAGAARVALDVGALGGDWAFGADGVNEPAHTKDAALEALARSAHASQSANGEGLSSFIRSASVESQRAVVFVPAKPGPWLDGVVNAVRQLPRDAAGRAPVEFVVCTDGVAPARTKKNTSRWSHLAMQPDAGEAAMVAHDDLQSVMSVLGSLRTKILVVDRRDGHVHASQG